MYRQRNKPLNTINNQGKLGAQKKKKSPGTKLKVMEDGDLNDRDFKITVMKKLHDL